MILEWVFYHHFFLDFFGFLKVLKENHCRRNNLLLINISKPPKRLLITSDCHQIIMFGNLPSIFSLHLTIYSRIWLQFMNFRLFFPGTWEIYSLLINLVDGKAKECFGNMKDLLACDTHGNFNVMARIIDNKYYLIYLLKKRVISDGILSGFLQIKSHSICSLADDFRCWLILIVFASIFNPAKFLL